MKIVKFLWILASPVLLQANPTDESEIPYARAIHYALVALTFGLDVPTSTADEIPLIAAFQKKYVGKNVEEVRVENAGLADLYLVERIVERIRPNIDPLGEWRWRCYAMGCSLTR